MDAAAVDLTVSMLIRYDSQYTTLQYRPTSWKNGGNLSQHPVLASG